MQQNYIDLSKKIRILSLELAHHARSSHTGGALSMADILTVIYGGDIINISPENIDSPRRDRFILSKGHCCASLYATLALTGYINAEELKSTYGDNGSVYYTHCSHKVPGVEISTGSLGHGLPIAIGQAIASKVSRNDYDVICLTGDGELDEGSNWEAILFAGHHKTSNLCLIVDYNKIQSMGDVKDILDIAPLAEKFRDFHWNVIEIDGHNFGEIENALTQFKSEKEKPTVIIANTIKGKGVSFIENKLMWHYHNPDDEELQAAKEELK
ncbi:MAG: transketolase [Bacteroidaceae bacterium]|jgi:transketolase|nr:transketolase [Bacteroidaceae bacterium]HAE23926.1 transketolase [Prevotellaceae bacterium]